MELGKKSEPVQVATLLTVIGEEAREVFSTFDWTQESDESKIEPVSFRLTLNHAKVSPLSIIVLIVVLRSLVKHMNNTGQHCTS